MLSILTFEPILKERIWGGSNLAKTYAKKLPPGVPIGESWEISDRPGDESVVAAGPWKGRTLHQLMEDYPVELLGRQKTMPKRFPILVKIIDAREKLSLQVHPPAQRAVELGGEPKTEMWYIAQAEPGAELYVGLKKGVTRADFETSLAQGTVAERFHRIPVKTGDAMFLPSGRVHALGAGIMIFEIQQNSDTTYRVFDWNRLDATGRPRQLHREQSLSSIDFNDFEPSLLPDVTAPGHPGTIRPLVKDKLFHVNLRRLKPRDALALWGGRMYLLGVVEGSLGVMERGASTTLTPGEFCLVPACCTQPFLFSESGVAFLQVELG
jgi:mannose-6-phosphate isomerase